MFMGETPKTTLAHLSRNGGKEQVTFHKDYLFMQRVPVISPDEHPLMPTKASRARRWLNEGKAKIYSNDVIELNGLTIEFKKSYLLASELIAN